jgi:hypothetical protein
MDINEAAKILSDHNKWRRGCDKTTVIDPKQLGLAIDEILKFIKKANAK